MQRWEHRPRAYAALGPCCRLSWRSPPSSARQRPGRLRRRRPRTARRSPVGTACRSGSPLRSPVPPVRSGSRCSGGASSPRRAGIERTSWTSGSSSVTPSCRHRAGRAGGREPGVEPTVLAVVGPAGSQEVEVSTVRSQGRGGEHLGHGHGDQATRPAAGAGFSSASSGRIGQQGASDAFMRGRLQASKVVVIDGRTARVWAARRRGLAAARAAAGSVVRESVNEAKMTDFSSLIKRIPTTRRPGTSPGRSRRGRRSSASSCERPGGDEDLRRRRPLLAGGLQIPGSYISADPSRTIGRAARTSEGRAEVAANLRASGLCRRRRRRACGQQGVCGRQANVPRCGAS